MDSKKKILIVEDDWFIAKQTELKIEAFGYNVFSIVPSGEEAIEKVEDDPPDLILMDIMLKGKIDGVEAAENIRSKYYIPIIFLTGYSSSELFKKIEKLENTVYFKKPCNYNEIHKTIKKLLRDQ